MSSVTSESTKSCGCKGEQAAHQPKHPHQCQCSSDSAEHSKHKGHCGCKGESQAGEVLSQAVIDTLIKQLAEAESFDKKVECFKKHHPQFRVVVCSEDDMAEREPYAKAATCDIFLIGKGEGCAKLTNDLDMAIGVVLATLEE
ncbi:hypothetical protein ACVFI8_01310 [Agarivorans sp. MS3-6]